MYCISFILGCFASMLHGVQANGGPEVENWLTMELTMAVPVLTAWIMALPVVISPDNYLAVSVYQVTNANLYFSSWGSFLTALYITDSVLSERFPRMQTMEASWTKQWVLQLLSSVITLASCVQLNQREHCLTYYNFFEPRESDFCQDLQIAVVLSSLSGGMALVLALFLPCTMMMPPSRCLLGRTFVMFLSCFCAIISTAYWVICLIHLTFDAGPGSVVGTPFFGAWTSFFLSVKMIGSHATYWIQRRGKGNDNDNDNDNDNEKGTDQQQVDPQATTPEPKGKVNSKTMTEPR